MISEVLLALVTVFITLVALYYKQLLYLTMHRSVYQPLWYFVYFAVVLGLVISMWIIAVCLHNLIAQGNI